MSLFPEYDEVMEVYRYTEPSGWEDPSCTLIGTVVGRIEPVAANEELLNNQDFQGIVEVAFLDIQYDGFVLPNDYIKDVRGTIYQNRGIPETWRHLIPYVMLKLERPQSPLPENLQ